MRKHYKPKWACRGLFSSKFFLTCAVLAISVILKAQYPAPGAQFKKVTWRDKDITNTPGLSQALSGDEWWYSHKNLYDNTGKQIGYIAVGYIADLTKHGDEQKIIDAFSEGSDSPLNFGIPASGSFFRQNPPTAELHAGCDELYNNSMASPTVDAAEDRTAFRGMLARLDMEGNMIWCRLPNIDGSGLQEVIQDGDYVYVIGTHDGVKTTKLPATVGGANLKTFIPYNPVDPATEISNYFSVGTTISPQPKAIPHMYVAKFHIDGTKQWERLYGATPFSTPNAAYANFSLGNDLILNSQDSKLYAVGKALSPTNSGIQPAFVAKIDPATGYLLGSALLPISGFTNSNGVPYTFFEAKSICEIGTSGKMAIAGAEEFDAQTHGSFQWHRGIIYSIDQNFQLNSSWSTNPREFPAVSGNTETSMIWEINYHTAKQEVLVGLVTDCNNCHHSGDNSGVGRVWRLSGSNGLPAIGNNPLYVGNINAYDLRLGVIETSDGGFAAVSTRRNGTYAPPTPSELGVFSTCITGLPSYWDTDPVIIKYDIYGSAIWTWSEDVQPGRPRTVPPGDLKRQECMYKISETQDKGLAISGNCSFNHDDYYMVKLYPDCNVLQLYNYPTGFTVNPTSAGPTTTWNSSRNIKGKLTVSSGATLVITGSATKIRFADSYHAGVPSYIEVQPGGKLYIQGGAEVTSIDNATCPGSMWDGIVVAGTSTLTQYNSSTFDDLPNHGYLQVSGSAILSNARDAITTGTLNSQGVFATGGVVRCGNSYFINNRRDVQFLSYHDPIAANYHNNKSEFYSCKFLINNVLNDGSKPNGRVTLWNVSGVDFYGCEFSYNAGSAYPPLLRGQGIMSVDAQYRVADNGTTQSIFKDFTTGIEVENYMLGRVVNVDHAKFTSSFSGVGAPSSSIRMTNVHNSNISRNTFTLTDNQADGIYLNSCKYYSINNNTFIGNSTANSAGIHLSNSQAGMHKAYRNDMSNLLVGIIPQFQNADPGNTTASGLIMNCNTFTTTSNYDDIAMLGLNNPGQDVSVYKNQGVSTKPVRNQYGASCSNMNKWYIDNNSYSTITHFGNTGNTLPLPTSSCSSPLVFVTSGSPLNYTIDCPANESSPPTGSNPCAACQRLVDINTGLSTALTKVETLKSDYLSVLDGGDTDFLLGQIYCNCMSEIDLRALMLANSPYLSDTVLKAYFNKMNVNVMFAEPVHKQNAPVAGSVWQVIKDRNYGGPKMDSMTVRQERRKLSLRATMEAELSHAKFDLGFVYSEKIAYYQTDTLNGNQDTVIALLASNKGELPDAPVQLVHAYASAGAYTRAFAYADSLSSDPRYTELMTLQQVLLKLDTARSKAYKIMDNASIRLILENYAADSTKAGSWQARAVLKQVYGNDMHYIYLWPDLSESRMVNGLNEDGAADQGVLAAQTSGLRVYPNPATDGFTLLYASESVGEVQYHLNDILGNELRSGVINPNVKHEVTTERLGSGIYFITLIQDDKLLEKQKLIILR